jgi:hypothetical protein
VFIHQTARSHSSHGFLTEGEHVNRGRDTPSFYPTLQVLDISNLGDAADDKFGNFSPAVYRHRCLPTNIIHLFSFLHQRIHFVSEQTIRNFLENQKEGELNAAV